MAITASRVGLLGVRQELGLERPRISIHVEITRRQRQARFLAADARYRSRSRAGPFKGTHVIGAGRSLLAGKIGQHFSQGSPLVEGWRTRLNSEITHRRIHKQWIHCQVVLDGAVGAGVCDLRATVLPDDVVDDTGIDDITAVDADAVIAVAVDGIVSHQGSIRTSVDRHAAVHVIKDNVVVKLILAARENDARQRALVHSIVRLVPGVVAISVCIKDVIADNPTIDGVVLIKQMETVSSVVMDNVAFDQTVIA